MDTDHAYLTGSGPLIARGDAMNIFDHGQPTLSLLAVVLSLGACGTDPPLPEAAAHKPAAMAAPQESVSLFGADPDGEEWFLSDAWMETTPCRVKAQLIYTHAGLRMRGQPLKDQLQAFNTRSDIGMLDPAEKAAFETLLKDLYATPITELPDLGTRVAADCLAATPQVGVDRERALHCYRRHQEANIQRIHRDQRPAQAGADGADVDFEFHRCLRGDRT
jgi:hypothetical protein